MAKTTDGMKIIDNMIGEDEKLRLMCEEATVNAHVAQLIYDSRIAAGLTQKELADTIGTTESVISSLEDGDYERCSLSMLIRIAQSLNCRVEIDFIPIQSIRKKDSSKLEKATLEFDTMLVREASPSGEENGVTEEKLIKDYHEMEQKDKKL